MCGDLPVCMFPEFKCIWYHICLARGGKGASEREWVGAGGEMGAGGRKERRRRLPPSVATVPITTRRASDGVWKRLGSTGKTSHDTLHAKDSVAPVTSAVLSWVGGLPALSRNFRGARGWAGSAGRGLPTLIRQQQQGQGLRGPRRPGSPPVGGVSAGRVPGAAPLVAGEDGCGGPPRGRGRGEPGPLAPAGCARATGHSQQAFRGRGRRVRWGRGWNMDHQGFYDYMPHVYRSPVG
jgi:hypothetical protein